MAGCHSLPKGNHAAAEPELEAKYLLVKHTTARVKHARTDARFSLIVTPEFKAPFTLYFPNKREDEREIDLSSKARSGLLRFG